MTHQVICKKCKEVVKRDLRDHWMVEHPAELQEIAQWLLRGKWENWVRRWKEAEKE